MKETKFYVYILTDPRKNSQPFYVGKGTGKRAWHHQKSSRQQPNNFKDNVVNAILKEGLIHSVKIIKYFENETHAFDYETKLIQRYGRRGLDDNGILANRTLGGEGAVGAIRSGETKKRMSDAAKGKPKPWLQNKKRPTEVVQKIANANRGKKRTKEQRTRLSDAHKGITHSEESNRKRSESLKGIKRSESFKENLSTGRTGAKNPQYGKRWLNKNGINKIVAISEAEILSQNGWVYGRTNLK